MTKDVSECNHFDLPSFWQIFFFTNYTTINPTQLYINIGQNKHIKSTWNRKYKIKMVCQDMHGDMDQMGKFYDGIVGTAHNTG